MLKIGEFAKIFNVTIKTIRFYEEKELLKPCYIDKYSGYRYYDDENIKQMNQILYLKKLGFSLEEIKSNWNHFNNEVMLNKKKELEQKLENINESIKKIDYLRSNIVDGKIIQKLREKDDRKVKTLY